MPALCHRIHKSKVNPAQYGGQVDINLVGIAIGNGWMSPIEQGKYASYLYYHGLLDGDQYLTLLELEDGLIAKVMIMLVPKDFLYSFKNCYKKGVNSHRNCQKHAVSFLDTNFTVNWLYLNTKDVCTYCLNS